MARRGNRKRKGKGGRKETLSVEVPAEERGLCERAKGMAEGLIGAVAEAGESDKEQGGQRTGSRREGMTDGGVSRCEKYQYEKWM